MASDKEWRAPRGKVLVLAPHPDDETIGCGGTLVLHRRQGDPVKVVFVTDGGAGDPRRYYRAAGYRALRRAEARRAAKVLGVGAPEFLGFPDGRLAQASGLATRLKTLLDEERPDVVYRPSAADPHRDHRALARSFESAAGRGFLDCRYEVCFLQRPTAWTDISAAFVKKTEALRQYRSQLRYHAYLPLIAGIALRRGLSVPGAAYAEAFRVTRR